MKKALKKITSLLGVLLLILITATTAFAHSGRTDSSGGHHDNKNKSGLGSYHYHCGGYPAHLHTNGYCPYRDIFPSSVTIKADKNTLGIGEEVAVAASIYPNNACDTDVTWSCSDPSVVSVYNGVITAKNYGTATITAETFNGKTGTLAVTVKEITADKVSLTGLPESSEYYIGDEFTLSAVISPDNVDDPSIVWSSSNEEIATVSSSGGVSLISDGEVKIRATASNGVAGKAKIHVKERYVDAVDITDDELDAFLGEQHTIHAVVTPENATYPDLIWTIEDPSIVSVSEEGVMTALACGETVVTATSRNGRSDSIFVKVNEVKAESVTIEGRTSILLGDTLPLTAAFSPANTSDQDVKWSVDQPELAEISADGTLTAKGVGEVVVTVIQKDATASCTVEVLPIDVEEIRITTNTEDTISKGDTVQFYAEVLPKDATYPEISWSVRDPERASIDADGTMTALKSGTVTVIATSEDGFCSEYVVKISSPVAGVIGVCCGGGRCRHSRHHKKKEEKVTKGPRLPYEGIPGPLVVYFYRLRSLDVYEHTEKTTAA